MLDERFINFFEKIKLFKEEQKKQKQRGLNDYNMVNVVRKENAEVGMHSNVIYSLIDPNGLHYQDELFLQIFIKDVLEINDFGNILSVQAEESTNENKRVEFTIKSNNYYIGIEMKVDASDLENQISHYYDDLKEKASKDSNQEVIIYYLTKNGKDASLNSHNNKLEYKRISFENHILTWIENCQKEVKNITNLNEAFENYKDIVKKITNKYDFEHKDKQTFMIASSLCNIGKLTLGKDLLEKVDDLDIYEIEKIKTYPYYTKKILQNIIGFADIASWAIKVQERLDGSGYISALSAKDLNFKDRLLQTLNAYNAIRQDRVYRELFSHDEAIEILKFEASENRFDITIIEDLDKILKES